MYPTRLSELSIPLGQNARGQRGLVVERPDGDLRVQEVELAALVQVGTGVGDVLVLEEPLLVDEVNAPAVVQVLGVAVGGHAVGVVPQRLVGAGTPVRADEATRRELAVR